MSLVAIVLALWSVAEGPVKAPPGATSFHLGALEITALRDGGYVSPNDGGDYGSNVGPQAVAEVLAGAGAPEDAISLSVDALLVRTPSHVVLLDTGLGPGDHGALPASLRLAGVSPDQVTDVLITHAHHDHIGGLLTADGKSAFPRAVIWISDQAWISMRNGTWTRKLAAAIAPQVRAFEPGRPILPGITPIALPGHAPGHVGFEIVSRGRKIEDIGDLAHSSIVSLAKPSWRGWIDEDPKAASMTRRAELKRLAASHELVFAPHFPFPGVGWIVPRGDGYAWAPDPEAR